MKEVEEKTDGVVPLSWRGEHLCITILARIAGTGDTCGYIPISVFKQEDWR